MDYDAVIVGAGPGGAMAAKTAAEKGSRVLLVEKRPEIGMPVRCGEATGLIGFKELGIKPDKRFIAWQLKGEYIYYPSGGRVEIVGKTKSSCILERRLFDKYLAIYASKAGAEVKARTYATGLIKEDGFVKGVKLKHFDEEYEVECGVVVGADGIEGKVGRWAGLSNRTKLSQMASNVEFEMAGIELENPEVMELYFGSKFAPGGYVWVFPKGEDIANVGLGIRPSNATAYEYLKRFIESKENLRKGKKVSMIVGGVPVEGPIEKSFTNGVILVGDAARHVDPLTGGGIFNAMSCGVIAGKIIKEAVDKQDFSEKMLSKYEKEWRATVGKNLQRSLKIKEGLEKMSDEDINAVGEMMKSLNIKELDIKNVGKTLLKLPPEFVDFVKRLIY